METNAICVLALLVMLGGCSAVVADGVSSQRGNSVDAVSTPSQAGAASTDSGAQRSAAF